MLSIENQYPLSLSFLKENGCAVFSEITKIACAVLFIEMIRRQALTNYRRLDEWQVINQTVLIPLFEEIIFRGFLHKGIHVVQSRCMPEPLTDKSRKIHEVFRVHVSVFIFALTHLKNRHPSAFTAVIHVAWSYWGGVTYAYLTEKYHTLAIGILGHSFNNLIYAYAIMYPKSMSRYLCLIPIAPLKTVIPITWPLIAICVNQLSFYILSIKSLSTK